MTATMPEKPRTRRPKIAKLDRDRIRREEHALVAAELNRLRSPERRLRAASTIVNEAEQTAASLRAERDEAALSLSLYDGVRAMQDVIGVSRAYFHTMRGRALQLTDAEREGQWLLNHGKEEVAARASHCAVPHLERDRAVDAASSTGQTIARAEERADAARVYRNSAVVELVTEHKWSRGRVAEVAGFDVSRVSQILTESLA